MSADDFETLIVRRDNAKFFQQLVENASNPAVGVYDRRMILSIPIEAYFLFVRNLGMTKEMFEDIVNRIPDINALHKVIEGDYTYKAKKLVDYICEHNMTYSIFSKDAAEFALKLLLQKGANISDANISCIISTTSYSMLLILVNSGFKFNENHVYELITRRGTVVFEHSGKIIGMFELIQIIINSSKDINLNSLLHRLLRSFNSHYIKYIEHFLLGADPNSTNEQGETVVQFIKKQASHEFDGLKQKVRNLFFPKMITIDGVGHRISFVDDTSISIETLGKTGFSTRTVPFIESGNEIIIPNGTDFIRISLV